MRFISLWVNTAFSTKYGSIFIMASWMGSTTRCILLSGKRKTPGLSAASYLLFISLQKESKKGDRRRVTGSPLLSDRLTDSLQASVLLSEEVPSVRMPHPLVSSSSSLIWACLCVRASQTPAWSDVLQSPPAASGRTHNCERLLHPSVCLVSSRYFTPCSNTFTPARRKAQVWLLNSR